MAFDIQAARDAGYSEAEINAYLQAKPETKTIAPVAPGQEVDSTEPPPPEGTVEYPSSLVPGLATAGLGLASAAVPIGIGYGVGKYGGRAMDLARNVMSGTATPPPGSPGGTPIGGTRVPITTPTTVPAPQMQPVPQMQPAPTTQAGRAYSPQAQQFMQSRAPAPAPAPQMQAAKSIVQKLALDKVMAGAGGMLRGSVGPGMALYSGGLNTNEQAELERRRKMAPTITR